MAEVSSTAGQNHLFSVRVVLRITRKSLNEVDYNIKNFSFLLGTGFRENFLDREDGSRSIPLRNAVRACLCQFFHECTRK